jgi:hypothetical protein
LSFSIPSARYTDKADGLKKLIPFIGNDDEKNGKTEITVQSVKNA